MAHVCISSTARAGDELGYDLSVIKDGIGDRDVPGASASQLVEVRNVLPFFFRVLLKSTERGQFYNR